MEIRIDSSQAPVRVALRGNLVGEANRELDGALMPLVSDGGHDVVVDLAEVGRIDSQGLGVLVNLTCRSNLTKGRLVFARPSPYVDELFSLTQLKRFLNVDGGG